MNLPYAYDEKIETDLKIALEKKQFRLYYQPKIDVVSGGIIGVEALIRWEHPEKGIISPLDFIPVAEATGLILPIGEWVLREACKQNKMWQEEGLSPFIMAVNLSVRQLHQSDLVQVVQDVLVETELAPEYLELEITESMMMNVQRILPVVKDLKKLGVRLSLDDFGTGYSSLRYLREFPIDEIKIDQSFIRVCTSDTKNATIVKAIIAMAHQLQLEVVAEGVETKEQLVFLQQYLCNKAQGYLFSKPVLPDELVHNFKEIEKVAKREKIPEELSKKKQLEPIFERPIKKFEDIEYALNESSIVAITNQKGIIQFVNDKFCEISKYTREELMGQDHKILNSGYHPKMFFKEMWRTIGQGKTWSKEIRNKAKDGSFYWVYTTIVPFLNDRGMPYQYISIRTDITKRKRMEEALRVSEERYRLITNNMTDLVSLIDRNGFFKYTSPSHAIVLGFPIEVFERKNIEDLIHSNDLKQVRTNFEKTIELKKDRIFEFRCKDIVGNWMWLEAKATPIFDAEGRFEHFLMVSREISERKMYEEKLTHMAYHDTLTDLPNRRLFLNKLKEFLEEAERHKRKMAVIYIDMDGFKQINDTYGHDVGDEILKRFVGIVQANLHESMTFARQGGDEFTILMSEIQGKQDAMDISNRIVNSLRAYRNEDHPLLKMSASLGISLYPEDGRTGRKLMECADKALYKVKKDGKDNFRTYS